MKYRRAPLGVDRLTDEGVLIDNIRRGRQADAAAWADYVAHTDADGEVLPLPVIEPPTEADDAYRAEARRKIDEAAGRARARYITVSPGQDATYTAKYDEAKRFLAAWPVVVVADYPWIEAEAAATGVPEQAAASRIKTQGDIWYGVKGPAIEATRVAGKDAITPLTLIAEVDSTVAAVVAALGVI